MIFPSPGMQDGHWTTGGVAVQRLMVQLYRTRGSQFSIVRLTSTAWADVQNEARKT